MVARATGLIKDGKPVSKEYALLLLIEQRLESIAGRPFILVSSRLALGVAVKIVPIHGGCQVYSGRRPNSLLHRASNRALPLQVLGFRVLLEAGEL
jgi:hypothetical protein